MRKSRLTESQIVAILNEGESGIAVAEVCRKHGIRHLFDALRTEILKQGGLHADETPITTLCAKQALKTGSASKEA